MQIKILFDKITEDKSLHTGWGVSFLINGRILFDTGENGQWLLENMQISGIDVRKIEAVIISHDHWDHTGGLWEILVKGKGLKVYSCPHFSKEFKEKVKNLQGELIEADNFMEISKDIFVTGEIGGAYNGRYMPEQALMVKTKNGLSVITGCAHPSIIKILGRVKEKFPDDVIYSVFGGFHLKEDDKRAVEIAAERFKEMKIKKAGPTHCSGEVAEEIFKEQYGDNFIQILVGQTLEI
ncbi:MAG: MBL fold metallo-hydrolase [Candidatus Omnitrophica bacterium]|nr:MBL fold metallo-hydrolase [Candidatus Omnitrophota bacterium]MBU4488506.1 MBL fold metallo-hydrolase [Candidatus Omnitrophota bacterium]MCG2704582.1 MBL fold metallo-hydrolase [Candidatus Omnitrophota bacterium]